MVSAGRFAGMETRHPGHPFCAERACANKVIKKNDRKNGRINTGWSEVKKYVASKRRGSAIIAVLAATTFQKDREGLVKQVGMIKG